MCHVFYHSVCSNGNLEGGGNMRAILSNWRVNRAFLKKKKKKLGVGGTLKNG